jgi:manganese transport protein
MSLLIAPPAPQPETASLPAPEAGWRKPRNAPSLREVYASIKVPPASASFWRKLFAFWGPGLMVAVGYMDPGGQIGHCDGA